MPSITVENYLKALLSLTRDSGETGVSDLSRALGVSTPTANNMVKKLAEEGLVYYERYRPLRLTRLGNQTAAQVLRKHRLTEMYLVEKMNFGWEEVHHIAEQIEHIQSPAFFERMDELMGFPTHDPHGSPIPDRQGRLVTASWPRLSSCRPGERVRLVALDHDNKEFLEFLNTRQLALGTEISIRRHEPFDGSMVVDYADHDSEALSKTVTDRLLVERLATAG